MVRQGQQGEQAVGRWSQPPFFPPFFPFSRPLFLPVRYSRTRMPSDSWSASLVPKTRFEAVTAQPTGAAGAVVKGAIFDHAPLGSAGVNRPRPGGEGVVLVGSLPIKKIACTRLRQRNALGVSRIHEVAAIKGAVLDGAALNDLAQA